MLAGRVADARVSDVDASGSGMGLDSFDARGGRGYLPSHGRRPGLAVTRSPYGLWANTFDEDMHEADRFMEGGDGAARGA